MIDLFFLVGEGCLLEYKSETCTYRSTSRKLVHTGVLLVGEGLFFLVGEGCFSVYKSETCTYGSTSRKLVHTSLSDRGRFVFDNTCVKNRKYYSYFLHLGKNYL
jgi:hypothetical protein